MRGLIFAVALASTGGTQAAVYHWQTVDPASSQYAIGGRLEIDDAAPQAFDYVHEPRCWSCSVSDDGPQDDYSDPNSLVISISMSVEQMHGVKAPMTTWFEVNYRTGEGWVFYSPDSFTIDRSSGLAGAIYADDGATGIAMTSTGDLWTIEGFLSDRGPVCAEWTGGSAPYSCEGVTGRWVLQQQVPLPGTLALLGIGALLLRRQQERREPQPQAE